MLVLPIFLLGTRGDILPVVSLLVKFCSRSLKKHPTVQVVLVTHQSLIPEVEHLFVSITVQLVGLKCTPIDASSSLETFDSTDYINEFVQRWNSTNCTIIAIICNLFALRCFHFALKCDAQIIIIHPTVPVSNEEAQRSLLSAFHDLRPGLYGKVINSCTDTNKLSMMDFEYWLWPTLADDFDEAALHSGDINGPVVLILASPRLCKPLPSNPRYHLCGSVVVGEDGEVAARKGAIHSLPELKGVVGSGILIVDSTIEAVSAINELGYAPILVDFGSMTPLLAQDGRLQRLVHLLCQLRTSRTYVMVCHGCGSAVADAIRALLPASEHRNISFLLVARSVDHQVLLRKCSVAVHHGGIGTASACMHAGVPQLVLAVMYDQFSNGERVVQLGLGLSIGLDDLLDQVADLGGQQLEEALTRCSSPPQRLRSAGIGRDVRADPAENGLVNALQVLEIEFDKVMDKFVASNRWVAEESEIKPNSSAAVARHPAATSAMQAAPTVAKDLILCDDGTTLFPNGLRVLAHAEHAPEETIFLFEEIFEREIYAQSVAELQPGDLVVDAGANIGLFSLYAAKVANGKGHSHSGEHPFDLQVVAVEPIPANARLLTANLQAHGMRADVYHCVLTGGLGSDANLRMEKSQDSDIGERCVSVHAWTPSASSALKQKSMRYYKHMPGNSCSAECIDTNVTQQQAHMSAARLAKAQLNAEDISCPAVTLSDILSHYLALQERNDVLGGDNSRVTARKRTEVEGPGSQTVALLKIDVEGDELQVLEGITSTHWRIIERVVVEVNSNGVQQVQLLLEVQGLTVQSVQNDEMTGNSLVYATRTVNTKRSKNC